MAAVPAGDRLTEQQREAVLRREVSVLLSSGAGCGKTHVLTSRYLSHLERDGAEVSQIVAITFTERAARQMRDRIRKSIQHHLAGATTDEEARRWEGHLRGLETAQISTIHAFCGNLLRQHAVEAGLDPRFDVLEDYLAANLQREALIQCLQGLLTADTQPGDDLRELILLYGWRPVVEGVARLTAEEETVQRQAWAQRPAEEVAADWRTYARSVLLPRYVPYLSAASPKIARCLWLLRTTPCVGPKMAANVALVLERLPRLAQATDLTAAVSELTEAAKVGPERAKAWPSAEVYEVIKDALEDFRKALPERLKLFLEEPEGLTAEATAVVAGSPDPATGTDRRSPAQRGDLRSAGWPGQETVPQRGLAAEAEVGQRFVRVAEEAARAYRQLKRRHAVVDFQDLLVRSRDLLRDHPEVRERLQRRFQFLLIDELQDTDPVQMELVELLAGAGLEGGKLFAVGDHSQAIYRFRKADVRLFQALKRRTPHEGRLELTVNFRSQPAILDFANALFGPGGVPRANDLEDYEPLKAHHRQANPGPCVEFLWAPREPGDFAAEARRCEADWIARRIASMVGAREQLVVECPKASRERERPEEALRPVRLGDVVLLFRSMTNVELYESALSSYGLDYYLVGGRAFFAQQEIYDLLNLLRALENPQDAVSLAGTLRSPFCCLSDEALFVLTRHHDGPWAALHDEASCARLPHDQRQRANRARRFLDRWHALKDRLPIARLLGVVFSDSGYDAATQFEFLGDRKLANLWKLMDMARAFDRSGLFGLAEFIGRLGELVRTQPREEQAATQPENADVVRLMTIHQAKGLEFPVVILADLAASGGAPHNPVAMWDPKLGCVARPPSEEPPPFPNFAWRLWEAAEAVEDWREELRTLYVACTRAMDYLLLSAALPPDFSPQSTWMLALAERFNLRSGVCLDTGIPAEKVPAVRVSDPSCPPPESAGPPPRARPPAITLALPARGQETPTSERVRILTAAELDPSASVLPGGAWDAEDGSDRWTWELPRERVERLTDPEAALRDRLIRAVLSAWDFRESGAWEPLLLRVIEAQPAAGALLAELTEAFRRFVGLPVFRQLARARDLRREVEYLAPLSSGEGLVRGVIDCLWQDAAGAWHLLLHDTVGEGGGRGKSGSAVQTRLALAALAVESQLGSPPKTARCHHWRTGRTTSLRRSG
ncbi:MAG: UvrD-helicase domain-containing protein [Gemmataceae bacterium]|nr:UvrD-helicase domain-containing protein [Gemmataceae bacterium]